VHGVKEVYYHSNCIEKGTEISEIFRKYGCISQYKLIDRCDEPLTRKLYTKTIFSDKSITL